MKNRVNPLVLTFAAVLMLSGCASTELLAPADEAVVGTAWNADAGVSLSDELPAVARSEWWKAWKDAELSALVDRAMAESTDVRTALANLKTAAASADQATADLFPTVRTAAARIVRIRERRKIGAPKRRVRGRFRFWAEIWRCVEPRGTKPWRRF